MSPPNNFTSSPDTFVIVSRIVTLSRYGAKLRNIVVPPGILRRQFWWVLRSRVDMQATSFSPPLCARLAIFRCTVRENDIYSFICYLPPLDLTPFRRMSLYRGGTSGTTLKKLSVFHGLRNYLSLTPRSHLIPHLRANLRSSFNVYRRPSVSSITPSLELGPRFSAPLVLFFLFILF